MSSGETTGCNEQPNAQSNQQSNEDAAETESADIQSLPRDQQTLQVLIEELSEDLEPLTPHEGVERYINHRTDITELTKSEYRRKLELFVEFSTQIEIDNLNELSGREIAEYQTWRREDSTDLVESLSAKTMRDDMFLLRDFVGFLESIEAVSEGLSDKVRVPEVGGNSGRDIELEPDRLQRILEYLDRFEYASFDHVVFCLFKETGRREGGLRALDLEDYHNGQSESYLEFRHRPCETRLKNGEKGEATVGRSHRFGFLT